MSWEQQKNWYLAPTMVDAVGSVQVADGRGAQVIVPAMIVHIGRTEDAPTECIVGIPREASPPQGWVLLSLAVLPAEFSRLFSRAPVEAEYLVWVP